jgi:hypothetical protein
MSKPSREPAYDPAEDTPSLHGDTAVHAPILPPAPEAIDADELRAWAESRTAEAMEALDAEAGPEQFRDDGELFHGRLPDPLNPWVTARAPVQVLPAPVTSVYPGALVRVRSWWVTP